MRRRYIGNSSANSKYGVFILHTNGDLYKRSEWSGSSSYAVGVAVVTPAHSFVIAKNNVTASEWGPSRPIPGVTTTAGNYDTARSDYKGRSNTDSILSYYSNRCAAWYCNEYTFPGGKKGYLPAGGEFHLVGLNISEVNACLEFIGTPLRSGDYWTSTQWHQDSAWAYDLNGHGCWGTPKSNTYSVRPFTSLE